ncbi:hypothetical protein KIPE111705_07175 [Kibdelosporangium persicum]|uniref:hypothetical protein n=1 Tax=Kibdelosporangium persicum TaxID=2698649 RepID=UPI0015678617|nr:hypothetical protein [Kibdelosporangium persicum]
MRIREFENLLVKAIEADDHPEIVSVDRVATDERDTRHTRVRTEFANGARTFVMVQQVTGPNIPRHAPYNLPKEAL